MATRDYSSIYGIKDFILNDIAPSYFNVDDISQLNVGLFGMLTDIASTTTQDNFNVTARYITELLPGKSVLPEFIYAEASNYGINDIFANCSSCKAMLFIKEEDILNNGSVDGDYINYYIDSDMKVYIDDVIFTIPYDIKIRAKLYNGQYNYNCTYDNTKLNNSLTPLDYPYIKYVKTHITNEKAVYLALQVDLFQYNREVVTETIVTNNTLNIPYIDVPFEDNLCNFEVIYKTPDGSQTSQLQKLLDNNPATSKPFCYYKLIDEHTLRISFTTNDIYFVPEYKSELDIYLYQCKGDLGNFSVYTGDNIHVEGYSNNETLSYNTSVPMFCTMVSDAEGGKTAYTVDELARLTWEATLSVYSRTTESDLNRYFSSYTAIHDTEATFIKTRDDYATREYACYSKIKDGNTIFPTNTLNMDIYFDDIGGFQQNKNRYLIEPGRRIVYKDDSDDTAIIISDEAPTNPIEYTTICLMSIDLNPNNISYYLNSIDKNVNTYYDYINDSALFQFIIKQFHIKRNAIKGEMSYDIKITLLPSDSNMLNSTVYQDDYSGDIYQDDTASDTPQEEDPNTLNVKNISVYLYLNNAIGYYIKLDYIESESSSETGYVFNCKLDTQDIMTGETVEISNLLSCLDDKANGCSVDMEHPYFSILVFYKEFESDNNGNHDYALKIRDTANTTLCNTFNPDSNDYYLIRPLTLFKSSLDFNQCEEEPEFYMNITGVPLFSRNFLLLDDNHMSTALEKITSEHDFISDTLSILHALFEIHIKLFNTYGKSKTFTTDSGEPLNRTYCDINMGIKLNTGIDESCLSNIKITIKDFIETLNNNESGVNSISISQLIKTLHNTYTEEIDAIVFKSFNGYDSSVQLITMNKDLASSEFMNTIPEFLTINVEDITLTTI